MTFRVLIGYARSGVLGRAFAAHGVEAWECDVLPSSSAYPRHIQNDVRAVMDGDWAFGVFHPVCTYLTGAAAWALRDPDYSRWPGVGYHQRVKPDTLTGAARRAARQAAIADAVRITRLSYPWVIENPVGGLSAVIGRPDQIIQPHQFGDDASKATCLWLAPFVPMLAPSTPHPGRQVEWPRGSGKMVRRWLNQTDSGQNRLSPDPDRAGLRSATYQGIAVAMAEAWAPMILRRAA